MKKLLKSIAIICTIMATLFFNGCSTVPTVEQMSTTSQLIGITAGTIASKTKIDNEIKIATIDIVNNVTNVVPMTNQTFATAWNPVAKTHIATLIENKKITTEQGVLIEKTFEVVISGIDYIFDVRYPKARQYDELIKSAVHGFCTGFLTTFNAQTLVTAAPEQEIKVDEEAYKFLSQKFLK